MSKGTERFKKVIKAYLDKRAAEDSLFAEKYANPKKNIDECADYIIGEVQKSGKNGFPDEEIFGMAVHYYDEENLKVDKNATPKCSVVVNHAVELTEEEKEKIRKEEEERAKSRAKSDYREKVRKELKKNANEAKEKEKPAPKNAEPKPATPKKDNQLDLFNLLIDEA